MTGTPCAACATGWLVCVNTRQAGERTVRYFGCWLCGERPAGNKTVSTTAPRGRARRRARLSSKPQFPILKPKGE